MKEKERQQVKTLLDALERIAVEWRKGNTDIAKPFMLECTIDFFREKLLGVEWKPRNILTIKVSGNSFRDCSRGVKAG